MARRDPPEIVVKFWPPSITARGAPAISAVRKPLAFVLYSRPFVLVAFALIVLITGGSYAGAGIRSLMRWIW